MCSAVQLEQLTGTFDAYHRGFREQVGRWPLNPVDGYAKRLDKRARKQPGLVVGDFGCGDAALAARVGHGATVHSFDLVANGNPRITPVKILRNTFSESNALQCTATARGSSFPLSALRFLDRPCDIAHVPLADASLDVAVFSLSLMGTDFAAFLREGARTLKAGGVLLVAEVQSRFCGEVTYAAPTGGYTGGGDDAKLSKKERKARKKAKKQAKKAAAAAAAGGDGAPAPHAAGVANFVAMVEALGFKARKAPDDANRMFVLFEFEKLSAKKARKAAKKRAEAGGEGGAAMRLKPCLYKRR